MQFIKKVLVSPAKSFHCRFTIGPGNCSTGEDDIDVGEPVLDDRRRLLGWRRQTLLTPPSTTMSEPVMNELSSEARKRAALAISSGCASLSMGV